MSDSSCSHARCRHDSTVHKPRFARGSRPPVCRHTNMRFDSPSHGGYFRCMPCALAPEPCPCPSPAAARAPLALSTRRCGTRHKWCVLGCRSVLLERQCVAAACKQRAGSAAAPSQRRVHVGAGPHSVNTVAFTSLHFTSLHKIYMHNILSAGSQGGWRAEARSGAGGGRGPAAVQPHPAQPAAGALGEAKGVCSPLRSMVTAHRACGSFPFE